ncbi:hypothetical protein [Arthrobacter bambusae]|uniref:Uncharacterized protein n=1 Tax=Arthrobacter bambusae TaxID=1338426 RepID=A0AAW8DFR3_9MICC|nr:hypothetical protein [Arthrobacter bambusae]MDP9904731.1 hypothetical protein [Arthrobacter bambusae]MDQ0129547.1 hypothetical protein [Arthrobacter bambusae]MDQ0180840.1 hypothetical protein [Arthrobacter bambusae]
MAAAMIESPAHRAVRADDPDTSYKEAMKAVLIAEGAEEGHSIFGNRAKRWTGVDPNALRGDANADRTEETAAMASARAKEPADG